MTNAQGWVVVAALAVLAAFTLWTINAKIEKLCAELRAEIEGLLVEIVARLDALDRDLQRIVERRAA